MEYPTFRRILQASAKKNAHKGRFHLKPGDD
jgi:hypothetical protein